jgi:hypothetical protein
MCLAPQARRPTCPVAGPNRADARPNPVAPSNPGDPRRADTSGSRTHPRSHDRRPAHHRQRRTIGFPCAGFALTALVLLVLVGCAGGAMVGPSETTRAATVPASSVRLAPTPRASPSTVANPSGKPGEARDYFIEVAFGAEFGAGPRQIHKWAVDPKISVHGDPNPEDLATLAEVVADLNEIIATINDEVLESGGNVDLHFAPERQFASIDPNHVPGNNGFVWIWWDGGGNITSGRVLVSTDLTPAPAESCYPRRDRPDARADERFILLPGQQLL